MSMRTSVTPSNCFARILMLDTMVCSAHLPVAMFSGTRMPRRAGRAGLRKLSGSLFAPGYGIRGLDFCGTSRLSIASGACKHEAIGDFLMRTSRRAFIQALLNGLAMMSATAAGITMVPRMAHGRPTAAPAEPDKLKAAIGRELGGAKSDETDRIRLDLPKVAEDGAVVPVTLESLIPATDRLVLLVEKNPSPLVAAFQFGEQAEAFVSLRIKMNESCDVIAIARASGKYYMTRKAVRVVVGGCG